ncbi:unnamed protein product [Chrysoparadoxa australica]
MGYLYVYCWAILGFCWVALTANAAPASLRLSLSVDVLLLGIEEDKLLLARDLRDAYPTHNLAFSAREGGSHTLPPLDVVYDVSYTVGLGSAETAAQYNAALEDLAEKQPDDAELPWLVPRQTLSDRLEELLQSASLSKPRVPTSPAVFGDQQVGMVLISSDFGRDYMLLGHEGDIRSCATSWLGQGRLLVVDLEAVGCGHEDIGAGAAAGASGAPAPLWLPVRAQLTSLVVSGVRGVIAPPVLWPGHVGMTDGSALGDALLVQVMELRGAGSIGGGLQVVDVEAVRSALGSVAMPKVSTRVTQRVEGTMDQAEVVAVGSAHALEEHPQLAVALARAVVHDHGSAYIDSSTLAGEMRAAGDELGGLLLQEGHWDEMMALDLALETGLDTTSQLLPVMVLCMNDIYSSFKHWGKEGEPQAFAFENGASVKVIGGGIMVLQRECAGTTEGELERRSQASAAAAAATQAVIEGALEALYALALAPRHSISIQGRSYSTSHGRGWVPDASLKQFVPFTVPGPGKLSSLLQDVAARNAVVLLLAEAAQGVADAHMLLDGYANQVRGWAGEVDLEGVAALDFSDVLRWMIEEAGLPEESSEPVQATLEQLMWREYMGSKDLRGAEVTSAVMAAKVMRESALQSLEEARDAVRAAREGFRCCSREKKGRSGAGAWGWLVLASFGAAVTATAAAGGLMLAKPTSRRMVL